MNELKNFWNNINKKVNVFLIISLLLLLSNVIVSYYVFEVFQEDTSLPFTQVSRRLSIPLEDTELFHDSDTDISSPIDFTAKDFILPDTYSILSEVNIFLPPVFEDEIEEISEDIDEIVAEITQDDDTNGILHSFNDDADTEALVDVDYFEDIIEEDVIEDTKDKVIVYRRRQDLSYITGYSIDGIIIDDMQNAVAVLKEEKTGNNFVVKENDFIRGSNIKVSSISQGRVVLSRRGSKDTELTLRKNTMFKLWLDAEPDMFNR